MFVRIWFCFFLVLFSSLVLASDDLPIFREDTFVVTGTRSLRLKEESFYSITVLSRKEIRNTTSLLLGDFLQQFGAANMNSNGYLGGQQSLSLRGLTTNGVLVLLDGFPTVSPLLGLTDLSNFTLSSVEKVEVLSGANSAVWGGNAVAGVVNIITQSPSAKEGMEIISSFGSFGRENYAVNLNGDNYFVNYSALKSNGFRVNSDFNLKNILGRLQWGKMSLLLTNQQADRGVPGPTFYPFANARQKDDNSLIGLGIDFSPEASLKLYNRVDLQRYWDDVTAVTTPPSTNNSRTSGLIFQKELTLFEKDSVSIGTDLKQDESDSRLAGRHMVNNGALYFNQEHYFSHDSALGFGLRLDSNMLFGSRVTPRLAFLLKNKDKEIYRISASGAFRPPTLNELFWDETPSAANWFTRTSGNPKLQPEYASNFEVAGNWLLDETDISLLGYMNWVENMIRWEDISGSFASYEAQNIGKAQVSGLELKINKNFGEDKSVFFIYNYLNAQNGLNGKKLTYSPQDKFNLGFICDKINHGASLIARFEGERFADRDNLVKMPNYTVADAKVWKKIKGVKLEFAIENLTNENYQQTYGFPMPQRVFWVGLNFTI